LLYGGCVVVWIGLMSFFGRNISFWAYFPIVLFSVLYCLFVACHAETSSRAYLVSASLILIFLLCLETLRVRYSRAQPRKHGYARRMAIVGLLILIAAHVLRIVMLYAHSTPSEPDVMSSVNALVVYLIPLAGTVLFFPALLLLYFERIKHQLLLTLESKQEALNIQTRFVEMFSHEYRTPLAVIRTNLDILQSKVNASGQHFGANMEKMQRAVLRLVEVAETALLSDQSGPSRANCLHEPIAMPDFLNAIVTEVQDFWNDRAPRFEVTASVPAVIQGDSKLLKTAFLNVIDNAVKYGPAQGLIQLHFRIHDGMLVITVEDNGPGIPEHELDQVYGKYFRGSRTSFVAGSGVGLYLVLRIIGQHSGSVVLSNRKGGGTSVSITLPLMPAGGL